MLVLIFVHVYSEIHLKVFVFCAEPFVGFDKLNAAWTNLSKKITEGLFRRAALFAEHATHVITLVTGCIKILSFSPL